MNVRFQDITDTDNLDERNVVRNNTYEGVTTGDTTEDYYYSDSDVSSTVSSVVDDYLGKETVPPELDLNSLPIDMYDRMPRYDERWPENLDEESTSYELVQNWSVDKVALFVEGEIKYPEYVGVFRENEIDGSALCQLSLNNLLDMRINPLHLERFILHIAHLKRKEHYRSRRRKDLKRKRENEVFMEAIKRQRIAYDRERKIRQLYDHQYQRELQHYYNQMFLEQQRQQHQYQQYLQQQQQQQREMQQQGQDGRIRAIPNLFKQQRMQGRQQFIGPNPFYNDVVSNSRTATVSTMGVDGLTDQYRVPLGPMMFNQPPPPPPPPPPDVCSNPPPPPPPLPRIPPVPGVPRQVQQYGKKNTPVPPKRSLVLPPPRNVQRYGGKVCRVRELKPGRTTILPKRKPTVVDSGDGRAAAGESGNSRGMEKPVSDYDKKSLPSIRKRFPQVSFTSGQKNVPDDKK